MVFHALYFYMVMPKTVMHFYHTQNIVFLFVLNEMICSDFLLHA